MNKFFMSRTRMKKIFLFASMMLFFLAITGAEKVKAIKGRELLDKIISSKKDDQDYALGYITGVFCAYRETSIPDDNTMKKIVKVVKKYLKKNPDKLNRPAVELLKEAFDKAFPEKKR